MTRSSKDLFDDSTMSFGEHLEVLRTHLWKAIIGVAIGIVISLFYGSTIIGIVRQPIDRALRDYGQDIAVTDDAEALEGFDFWGYLKDQFSLDVLSGEEPVEGQSDDVSDTASDAQQTSSGRETIQVTINAGKLGEALHQVDPQTYPEPPASADSKTVSLPISAPQFAMYHAAYERAQKVVALNVQEPFVTYLKVSLIAGLVMASPWVFYQLWQFIAAGLFPHERKFVYLYGTLSGLLFLIGVVFCFYLVFPFVLKFLLGFNKMIGVEPQIRLSEWISFAVTLPLLFGVSFQLPLVMLFLERLSIFEVTDYREKRRMAILVIAILSMFLTPADPISMLLMMLPLVGLYELGIGLCMLSPSKSPFEGEMTTA
jgi:sec-independent protein translocase protein TatC